MESACSSSCFDIEIGILPSSLLSAYSDKKHSICISCTGQQPTTTPAPGAMAAGSLLVVGRPYRASKFLTGGPPNSICPSAHLPMEFAHFIVRRLLLFRPVSSCGLPAGSTARTPAPQQLSMSPTQIPQQRQRASFRTDLTNSGAGRERGEENSTGDTRATTMDGWMHCCWKNPLVALPWLRGLATPSSEPCSIRRSVQSQLKSSDANGFR